MIITVIRCWLVSQLRAFYSYHQMIVILLSNYSYSYYVFFFFLLCVIALITRSYLLPDTNLPIPNSPCGGIQKLCESKRILIVKIYFHNSITAFPAWHYDREGRRGARQRGGRPPHRLEEEGVRGQPRHRVQWDACDSAPHAHRPQALRLSSAGQLRFV